MFDSTREFRIWKKRILVNLNIQGIKDVQFPQSQALVILKTRDEDEDTKKKRDLEEVTRLEIDEKVMNMKKESIGFEMSPHKIKVAMTMFDSTRDFEIWKKRILVNLKVQGIKDV